MLHAPIASRATRADQRRGHLIAVARKLFTENGFHSTGMAQIAAASGIRVGQIYRDFASKEDIVAAIVAEDIAFFFDEDELAAAIGGEDADAIRGWIDRFCCSTHSDDKCRLASEIAAEAARNDRIAAIQRGVDDKLKGLLASAFAALAPDPARAAERDEVTSLILALGKGLMYRRLVDPQGEPALRRRIAAVIEREIADLLQGPA